MVRSAVRRALGIHQIAPTLDFEVPVGEHIDWSNRSKPNAPGVYVNMEFNPFAAQPTRPNSVGIRANLDFFAPPSAAEMQRELELPSHGWNDEPHEPTALRPSTTGRALNVAGTYALVPMPEQLLVVHLERAQRRIDLEQWTDGSPRHGQNWLFPLEWTPPSSFSDAWSHRLADWGFAWEPHDSSPWIWTAGPGFCSPEASLDWLEGLSRIEPEDDRELRAWISQWLSAHPRRGNDVQDVMDRLFACSDPWTDDLGRPTARVLNTDELARFF
jgi:DNA mismatch repair ATPase MutL